MGNRQNQVAGDQSQQFQVKGDATVIIGIDEKRAREIFYEMNLQLKKDYSSEALITALVRINEFEERLMSKINKVEGAIEIFVDPSFQLLLVEAQKTAAATERVADYDLLSELLIHRFKKGEERMVRAGISRAVEIVDEISDEALMGLTVLHAVSQFSPTMGNIMAGLDTLNELFGKLLYSKLPEGNDWLDHLDILDALRLNSMASLAKFEDFYPQLLSGYTDLGIEKNSTDFTKAQQILLANGMPTSIFVEHQLNEKYFRLELNGPQEITRTVLRGNATIAGQSNMVEFPLSETQQRALRSIFDLYDTNPTVKNDNVKKLLSEWNKRPNLLKVRNWWDKIPVSFQITCVGRILAHSNAQRCDNNLPPIT